MGDPEFDPHRAHLHAVAYRILGSPTDTDDAVQEAWLRHHRVSGTDEVIANRRGWLTTVVARISLDMLRARGSRREQIVADPADAEPGQREEPHAGPGPEEEALVADALGPALLLVLDSLAPAERTAFVLHDVFSVPFEEIAPVVGRSVVATRQLASRGRRRVRGASARSPEGPASAESSGRRREIVAAFLAASRNGDFDGLLALLDPAAELRSDDALVAMGGPAHQSGADAVARAFAGRARGARLALLDRMPGAIWMFHGELKAAFSFEIDGDRIRSIQMIGDPATLERLDVDFDLDHA